MIKRISTITGLLVSLASVVSFIPVYADDYQKLDVKEGSIYNVTEKGGGCAFIDGAINGQDEAIYWLSGDGQYNKLDGVETGSKLNEMFESQYLEINTGATDYTYVDLKDNYKIVDYDVRQDFEYSCARIIKSKVKDDNNGRFDKDFCKQEISDSSSLMPVKLNGTNWYLDAGNGLAVYKYKLDNPFIPKDSTLSKEYSTIYGDTKGNYVDADYSLGDLKVYSNTTTGSSVTINNTEDTYELKDGDYTYELRAVINSDNIDSSSKKNTDNVKYQTAISDDVYRFAYLTIYKKLKDAPDSDYVPATGDFKYGRKSSKLTDMINSDGSITVLQKFSKTPATSTVDGIKYPKSSSIYFIADKDGNKEYMLGRSIDDASTATGGSTSGSIKFTGTTDCVNNIYLDKKSQRIYIEKITLKSKDQFNYVDISDPVSSDIDSSESGITACGGFPWFIKSGYIETFDWSKGFTKVYKVDAGLTSFSINNKGNLITWDTDKDLYSILHTPPSTTTTTSATVAINTTTTTSAAATIVDTINKTGWVINQDNTWNYFLENSTKKTGWLNYNGDWYYLNSDGIMSTGWINNDNTWYYLDASGTMKTGWINDGNTWYYCDLSGAMLSDIIIDGYTLASDGTLV